MECIEWDLWSFAARDRSDSTEVRGDLIPSEEENIMTESKCRTLPLADRARRWDRDAAEARVRRWAKADDGPNERYGRAFLWHDAKKADEFTAYKLPIADVIDGKLRAVPRAIFAAAQVLEGARGGVDLPSGDVRSVRRCVESYYEKMDEKAPWHAGKAA